MTKEGTTPRTELAWLVNQVIQNTEEFYVGAKVHTEKEYKLAKYARTLELELVRKDALLRDVLVADGEIGLAHVCERIRRSLGESEHG